MARYLLAAILLAGSAACGRVGFGLGARGGPGLDAAANDRDSPDASRFDAALVDAGNFDASRFDGGASGCPAPVAHWELDENGGSTPLDRVSSMPAAVQGQVTLSPTAGILGGAAEFNGMGAINVTFTDNIPTADFTWAAWIRPEDLNNRVLFFLARSDDLSVTYFKWASDSDAELVINDTGFLNGVPGFSSDSTWQHFALTRVGNTVTLYRNGELLFTGTYADPIDFASCVLRIGGGGDCAGTGAWQLWDGRIDDVRIYDEGLPASEIMRLSSMAPCP